MTQRTLLMLGLVWAAAVAALTAHHFQWLWTDGEVKRPPPVVVKPPPPVVKPPPAVVKPPSTVVVKPHRKKARRQAVARFIDADLINCKINKIGVPTVNLRVTLERCRYLEGLRAKTDGVNP